jgi:hypothetical protein
MPTYVVYMPIWSVIVAIAEIVSVPQRRVTMDSLAASSQKGV